MRTSKNRWNAGTMGISSAQETAEETVYDNVYALQTYWAASLDVEQAGDITQALEIHERILAEAGHSYTAYLRAGWLHSRAGGYLRSLEFYGKAARCAPGAVAPLFGAMGCHVAMGDAFNASKVIKAIIDLDALNETASAQLVELCAPADFHSLSPFLHPATDHFNPSEPMAMCGAA